MTISTTEVPFQPDDSYNYYYHNGRPFNCLATMVSCATLVSLVASAVFFTLCAIEAIKGGDKSREMTDLTYGAGAFFVAICCSCFFRLVRY